MTAATFKRKLKSGITWGYSFCPGRDENGKRIQIFKSGFETKRAAEDAARNAITGYESINGKVTREAGPYGRTIWAFCWSGLLETGFASESDARAALARAQDKRAADNNREAEKRRDREDLTFARYFQIWIDEHAARRCAPKTTERYREL